MSSTAPSSASIAASHRDGREVEWQLASSDLGAVRRWLQGHGSLDGLVLAPGSTSQILDTYFDTDDWRIYRAGYALRIRSEDGKSEATLKSLRSASTEMADRRELSEALERPEGDSLLELRGPVGSRIQAVGGAQSLQPLFEVHTSRQKYAVHAADQAQTLGEIALDETVISRPHGAPQKNLQRVEVEALTDAHEPLQTLVKVLRNECDLKSTSDSKYSEGLRSVGLAPVEAPQFAPSTIDPSMGMRAIALATLRRYLSVWHMHEPGARIGDDPEALHDLRVAGRRIDATLREFGCFLPEPLSKMRPTLKKALSAFGTARDLDVALLELDEFAATLAEEDRASLEPLRKHLEGERARARAKMLAVLDSSAVQKELEKLRLVLAQPSEAEACSAEEPAARTIPELIRKRYRKVRKAADRLTPQSPTSEYHAVRGKVKKLRYALETVAVIFGKPADEMVRALRRWQDKLGEQQDAEVASRRLRALATEPPKGMPPETLFVMGRLAAHYAELGAKAKKRHGRAYRKVRARWKSLKSELPETTPNATPAPQDTGLLT